MCVVQGPFSVPTMPELHAVLVGPPDPVFACTRLDIARDPTLAAMMGITSDFLNRFRRVSF